MKKSVSDGHVSDREDRDQNAQKLQSDLRYLSTIKDFEISNLDDLPSIGKFYIIAG